MIHDILASCLSISRSRSSLNGFVTNDAVAEFFHPCEREIFQEILSILNHIQEVVEFTHNYGKQSLLSASDRKGLYMLNFAKGVEDSLEDYYNELAKLERHCTENQKNSLIFIYEALQLQQPVALLLRKLIRETMTQNLHGCALLQNIQKQCQRGDNLLDRIVTKVLRPVKMTFYSHLGNWMLFGKIEDTHSEFFIKFTPCKDNSINAVVPKPATRSRNLNTELYSEDFIWQYEVNMKQLPNFLSTVWAEKVLFIGQTVLVFKMDRNLCNKRKDTPWTLKPRDTKDDTSELWNGKESMFFQMVDDLNRDDKINVYRLESVVDELKKYVSKRLSEIAVGEVNLEHQLGLIKDFYLLGRGEFYLEFLRQLYIIGNNSEFKSYLRSFETAANVLGISDDLENFTLSVQKSPLDLDESYELGILQNLHLKYNYNWPLNLLFSPTAIERYNKIFRFLLVVRKLQYDMHLVWATQTSAAKRNQSMHPKIMNLRSHLMFFLDNMQYYIQVDVLESQYSILIDVVKSKADFEEIQRAHTIFLANVLSQCFVLANPDDSKMDAAQSISQSHSRNPIYGTILEMFSICERFCSLCQADPAEEVLHKESESLEERFEVLIASLIKLLVDIKTASSLGPLSQLLLRLDYNHWFSSSGNNTTT